MVRELQGFARLGLRSTAHVVDRWAAKGRGIVVLAYHRVGALTPMAVDLPDALFAKQMHLLAETRRVARLDEALRLLAAPEPPETDPVVVTFDDGTADFLEHALPVLGDLGIPATLYVATAFIDEGRAFPYEGRPLSWAGLREAVASGLVDIGTHTHSHLLLDRVDADTAREEFARSVGLVHDRLGVEAVDFAYPKAVVPSHEVDQLARATFRSAALAGTRYNRYGATDPHALARSPIQVSDGIRWFQRKLDGGLGLEDRVRTLANRRRYAGATT